jgi:hypothetical protein
LQGKTEKREIDPGTVGNMIWHSKFEMRRINIELGNKLSETEIFLYINENLNYPISGFPRCLFSDEKDKISLYSLPPVSYFLIR